MVETQWFTIHSTGSGHYLGEDNGDNSYASGYIWVRDALQSRRFHSLGEARDILAKLGSLYVVVSISVEVTPVLARVAPPEMY